jgi:hypothetical protein
VKLFNGPLLRRRTAEFQISSVQLEKSTTIIANWVSSLRADKGIGTTREISVQGQFLIRIFEDCLGYSTQSAGHQQYTLTQEISIKADSADGGLGFYGTSAEKTLVVIELKDARTSLDRKQLARDRKETPVEGAESCSCSGVVRVGDAGERRPDFDHAVVPIPAGSYEYCGT